MNRFPRALARTTLVLVASVAWLSAVRADTATQSSAATVTAADPAAAAPSPLAAAKQRLYAATYAPTESLVVARNALAALSASDPRSAAKHYWLALADYRLVPRFMGAKGAGGGKDLKQAERWCQDGVTHLEQALRLDPKLADALALQAGIMGMQISIEPSRAMALGSQIQEAFGRAEAIAPRNPRVALMSGINAYHMPKFVGGGPDKALALLETAQKRFVVEKVGGEAIDWGHDDAYAWAGRAASELGRTDEARALYQKALAINPANQWVAKTLLPQLEKKAKS